MAIIRIILVALVAAALISIAAAVQGTATFYTQPYVPSTCFGFQDRGVMIAAVNPGLFNNGAACGQRYSIRCTGGTGILPNVCRNGQVTVEIVELCRECGFDQINLSQEAFSMIGNPDAGKIRINYNRV